MKGLGSKSSINWTQLERCFVCCTYCPVLSLSRILLRERILFFLFFFFYILIDDSLNEGIVIEGWKSVERGKSVYYNDVSFVQDA